MEFQTWKTIKLGTGLKTSDDFRKALIAAGCRIASGYNTETNTNTILDSPNFRVADKETDIELVNVSVSELGFSDGAGHEKLYLRAIECGLSICPAEVGPQLRLQYLDQPQKKGDWLTIGMEPIITLIRPTRQPKAYVFIVDHDEPGLFLGSLDGSRYNYRHATQRFVFIKHR